MLELLASFMTNPASSAIANALGSIRQIVRGEQDVPRLYLVVAPGRADHFGTPVQVQSD